MKLKILGVSAGGGLMVHPLKKYLIANLEIRGVYNSPLHWNYNFEGIPYHRSYSEALEQNYKPNVIVGHPDCGSGSKFRLSRAKKYSSIDDNESYRIFKLALIKYMPKVFFMETLEKIVDDYSEKSFRKDFKGYKLIFIPLNMSELGNSQVNRNRLIILGITKKWYQKGDRRYFKVKKIHRGPKTVSELFKGFDYTENLSRGIYYYPNDHLITLYGGKKLTYGGIQETWLTKLEGKTRWAVTDRKYTTAPGVYRNLPDSFPAVARKTNRQFNHLGLDMSPYELGIIQGIPDKFKTPIRPDKITYDLNKWKVILAKTPPYELGQWVKVCLKNYFKVIEKRKKRKEKIKSNQKQKRKE